MIQLYLPSAFADSFEDVIQERHLDEVELIPYRSFEGYSVKFSILAWNDYGVVLSVACGHESEVIIFLLRMPDEDEEFKVPPKAIEYEKKAPKFEVDSEVFRGFLLRFLDSFYPRGNYHQFTFIKIEDPGNSLLTPPDTPALPFQDHNEPPEMENFVFLEKSLELLRMENKTGCFETHQTIRPRSVPAAKVPKHLRQRVKSAK
ncbi:uncharacterized protein LOC132258297 [Phlebotomus argentipes]|uniref:uncharacterized protein LOC132258297 n=1 Tax=Phlebotomus argentipes TaxID=94469 RepID=UPI002892B3BC|nr:uncharacterized protein LOC132258297 [Phlebotomus argentipes]